MNKWIFKRHLDDPFIDLLRDEKAKAGSWWSEIVHDRELIIALRGDYLNVYFHGQSIFKVWVDKAKLAASTHPKYLLDPKLSNQVPFDGETFSLGSLRREPLLSTWGNDALARLKQVANGYSGAEKRGCHKAVVKNHRLLDVETAFSRDTENLSDDDRRIPRIDIAMAEPDSDGYRVQFWEAKVYGNPELGALTKSGAPRPVIEQIEDYALTIDDHKIELKDSYAQVCRNLVDIYDGTERYPANSAVCKIADNPSLLKSVNPNVNLFLFGFDAAQRKFTDPMFADLSNRLPGRVRFIGKPDKAFTN